MRIAAGVLIIIASIFDLFSGIGYGLLGGAGAVISAAGQEMAEKTKDLKAREAAAKVGEVGAALGTAGMLFGFFLLAMCGLCIAAGVVLFREKAATFALVVGVLQIAAEGIGFLLILDITIVGILLKLFMIVAAVLVIVAALSYRGKPAAPVPI